MVDRLYIIGNGFDRYHGLDTSYQSFGLYLQRKHCYVIYELLTEYFGLPDLDEDDEESKWDPLWSEFEQRLAEMEYDEILEDNSYYVGDAAGSNKASDWHAYEQVMDDIVDRLTVKLREAFKKFILNVSFSTSIDSMKLKLDQDATFFTFNYTDTLQRYYGIPDNNILHIHEKALGSKELILGHGTDPDMFDRHEDAPPDGLTDEEMMEWEQNMNDQYNFSYERGKDSLQTYYAGSHKTTESIIRGNQLFFDQLKNSKEVVVLGHSLSDVDRPYFEKIISTVPKNSKWIVSFYGDEERKSHKQQLLKMGLNEKQISLVTMDSLK